MKEEEEEDVRSLFSDKSVLVSIKKNFLNAEEELKKQQYDNAYRLYAIILETFLSQMYLYFYNISDIETRGKLSAQECKTITVKEKNIDRLTLGELSKLFKVTNTNKYFRNQEDTLINKFKKLGYDISFINITEDLISHRNKMSHASSDGSVLETPKQLITKIREIILSFFKVFEIDKVYERIGNQEISLDPFVYPKKLTKRKYFGPDIINSYLDAMDSVQDRLRGINYTNDDTWRDLFNEFSMEIQSQRIRVFNIEIQRIFIFDTEEEKENQMEIMIKQKDLGIQVRFIYEKELSYISRIPDTIDFGVIDNSFIIKFYLDEFRKIKYSEIDNNEVDMFRYRKFFDYLWSNCTSI